MYLTTFRKHGVGPGNWGTRIWGDPEALDRWLDEADATLNSWKEAHDVFNRHQGDNPKVDGAAFQLFRSKVYACLRDQVQNTINSYPIEAITYALLERWIAVRQAQIKIDAERIESKV